MGAAEEEKREGFSLLPDGQFLTMSGGPNSSAEFKDISGNLRQNAISFSGLGSAAEREREKAELLGIKLTQELDRSDEMKKEISFLTRENTDLKSKLDKHETLKEKYEGLQEELIREQLKYQKEMERLKKKKKKGTLKKKKKKKKKKKYSAL